jgi:hypothetical protein
VIPASEDKAKMSEVLLELADPLLDWDVTDAKKVDFIIQLTTIAWNLAMLPADRRDALEIEIIDMLIPDGDGETFESFKVVMGIVEERRKRLFPNVRGIVVDYDVQLSEGKVTLAVTTALPAADR